MLKLTQNWCWSSSKTMAQFGEINVRFWFNYFFFCGTKEENRDTILRIMFITIVCTSSKSWRGQRKLWHDFAWVTLGWHRVGWHWPITMSQCLCFSLFHKHCDIVIGQCHSTLCHPSAIRFCLGLNTIKGDLGNTWVT